MDTNSVTLLRMPDLSRSLGVARSTIYKMMKEQGFPKPIKLTRRAVAWRQEDVAAYLDRRALGCEPKSPPMDGG